jgi:Salmonella virulence plasmid 65kDa B protein
MKKIFILSFLLFQTVFYSQDNNLGTQPVAGVTPIKRIDTGIPSKKESNTTKENAISAKTAGTPTGSSQEIGITEGSLSVSLTGAASYSIPISVPPGINGVVPQVNLSYSSQGGNGIAGYGWNIVGVSAISRIPSTMFHDGVIDGVDFDNLDRFALDGQRLILKTGIYGGDGAEYETENFSNVKITSYGVSPLGANYGPAYFLVKYPDGSQAEYGNLGYANSKIIWTIKYWKNPQGIAINYSYSNENNELVIDSINYGANGTFNSIIFSYHQRQRTEVTYIGGEVYPINNILKEIQVVGNSIGFRNYVLDHEVTSLGY